MSSDKDKFRAFNVLMRKAEKLEGSETGYSRSRKPGYLKLAGGGWRDPIVHQKIIALYSQALELDVPPFLSLQRRAATYMYGGFLDEALSDLKALEDCGSVYAKGVFPVQLYLLRGEEEEAQKHLDRINLENKEKGLPRQKFADLRLSW